MAVKKPVRKAAAKVRAAVGRSAADIKKAWDKLEPELAKLRRDHERRGDTFSAITREEFEKKMNRVNSPMIVGQGWSGSGPAGGTLTYNVTVNNPDPVAFGNLAVTAFIGNRNAIANNDQFMTAFDERFGTFSQTPPFGFSLASGASITLSFSIPIPASVPKTGYIGNANLIRLDLHNVGTYLDRSCIMFSVT